MTFPLFTTAIYGTGGAVVFGVLYFVYQQYQLTSQRKGEPAVFAGPLPYLGFALELSKRPVDLFQSLANKTKDILGIVIAGQRMFILHDAHATSQLIKVQKGLSIAEFHDTVSYNLFDYSQEVIHSPHLNSDLVRKFYSQYLLNDKCLDKLCERMLLKLKDIYEVQVNQRLERTVAGGKPVVKLYDFIARFIFHVGLGAVFNENINNTPDKCDKLYDAFVVFDNAVALSIAGFHIKYQTKAYECLRYIHSVFDQNNENCSELIERRNQYFKELSQVDSHYKDIYGKLNFPLLWASVSNSMPATFWMIYNVLKSSKRDQMLQQIRDEIATYIPNYQQFYEKHFLQQQKDSDNNTTFITVEQLDHMHFIDSIFTETLRLVTGSFFMRVVVEDGYEIETSSGDKYRFRKGDRLGIFPPLFHLDDEIFPNAKEFNPYRFVTSEDRPLEERIAAAQGKIPMKKNGKELNS